MQTHADVDDGASGSITMDKDFKPTGEPPPDPPGANCVLYKKRIWTHGDDTAFLITIAKHGDWQKKLARRLLRRVLRT